MATTIIGAKPAVAVADTSGTKKPSLSTNVAPFRIQPLGGHQRWLKLLVYGPHGAGKTTTACSAADVPEMQDVLLVSAESGQMVLEDNPRVKQIEHLFDTGPITNFHTAASVLQHFLRPHCRYRDKDDVDSLRKLQSVFFGQPIDEIDEPIRLKTVVVDSIKEIEMYCIYQLLGIDTEDTEFKLSEDENMATPEWPEYKKNNQMVQILLRAYRDLPMNVIFSCPAKFAKDDRGVFHWTPSLIGQLATQVQGFVDIVGYIVAGSATEGSKEIPRRMFIQAQGSIPGIGKFDAKSRKASVLDAYIDNPTMPRLMKLIGA